MKINKLLIIIGWILVSISTQAFAQEEKISNEKIYRELKVFQAQTEERFKAMEQRFEQMDKRFEQLIFFLTLITSMLTVLVISVLGFAWWDRRSIIRMAREETIAYIKRNKKYSQSPV